MSQHPSLKSSDKNKQHRSVLKRFERIKILKDKGLWKDEDSVYRLPKVKVIKFKMKKEKAAAAEETAAAGEVAATPGLETTKTTAQVGKPTPQTKPQKESPKPQGHGGEKQSK
ncbi:MAG: hypothetical protein A2987_04675 [Omnitrophica bacterium RIFCSPLOWO2_01_FULL_45_10]|nr:MAG: hypothetical protein A2987_04675 [Omnitrophica bacterium RIFCSPLOWO2_01_FULL_45_10]